MAKTLHGEISLHIHWQRHTLRPSLGALYEIEQQLDMTIPALINMVSEGRASADMIRLILREGFAAHYGTIRGFPALSNWRLRKLWTVALMFLIHGMGFLLIEEKELIVPEHDPVAANDDYPRVAQKTDTAHYGKSDMRASAPKFNFDPLRWGDLYESARVLLGIGEEEFWRMTMPGLARMSAALARVNGADTGFGSLPATHNDLEWLTEQFPDEPRDEAA